MSKFVGLKFLSEGLEKLLNNGNKVFQVRMSTKNKGKAKNKVATMKEDSVSKPDSSPVTLDKSKNVVIRILAKPGAKQNAVTGISEEGVGIQIQAPPVDGEANVELIKYLSKVLGLRKSDLTLDKGSKSRDKIVKLQQNTLTVDEVVKLLQTESNK